MKGTTSSSSSSSSSSSRSSTTDTTTSSEKDEDFNKHSNDDDDIAIRSPTPQQGNGGLYSEDKRDGRHGDENKGGVDVVVNHNTERKFHVSRVPTHFTEEVVERILEEHLCTLSRSGVVKEVTLIYPRDTERQPGTKATQHQRGTHDNHAHDNSYEEEEQSQLQHRGFGFVTVTSEESLERALQLEYVRGGLKPTSTRKHTIYIRPYHDSNDRDDNSSPLNMCYLWKQNRCPYGDRCKFQHVGPGSCVSVASGTDKQAKGKRTRQKCFEFKKRGKCKRGSDCPFSHDFVPTCVVVIDRSTSERTADKTTQSTNVKGNNDQGMSQAATEPILESLNQEKHKKDCINWKTKGKCRKGDSCVYRHDEAIRQLALEKIKKREAVRQQERHQEQDPYDNSNNKNTKKKKKRRLNDDDDHGDDRDQNEKKISMKTTKPRGRKR